MKEKLLHGIKVIDLTRYIPGPFCTMILSDLGADVIRVEQIGGIEISQFINPVYDGDDTLYSALNRGKRSIGLNLKEREGKEIFIRLIKTASVLVEQFRPGVMERLGFDYERVKDLNLALVYCSITGYGQSGNYSMRGDHDINYMALSGMLHLFLSTFDKETPPPVQMADLAAGFWASIAILASLLESRISGKGRYIDLSMYGSILSLMQNYYYAFLNYGWSPEKGIPLSGGLACYNIYKTKDGKFISMGSLERKFWDNFCRAVGREDLIDAQYCEDQQGLRTIISRIISTKTRKEWEEIFRDVDACMEPVFSMDEAYKFIKANFAEIIEESDGKKFLGIPLRFIPHEEGDQLKPCSPYSDTESIMMELGFSGNEITRLKEKRIIV